MTFPPNAATIINKSIKALGGQRAADNILSIFGIADCTSSNGPYITELYSARTDRLVFKQIRPGRDPFVGIINGKYAWASDPATNEVEPLDDKSTAMIQGHDFLMLPLIIDQRFKQLEVMNIMDFEGEQCTKIKALDRLNMPCELYFNADSHLFAGFILANPIGRDGETVQIRFTSWQKTHNILLPATVSITDKSGNFHFTFRQVSVNTVAESVFEIPKTIETHK